MNTELRFASEADTETLLGIYRPYVEETTVTLEYDVPSLDEFKGRIREISAEFPYIACVSSGGI